jgi:hypothetical protein
LFHAHRLVNPKQIGNRIAILRLTLKQRFNGQDPMNRRRNVKEHWQAIG